MSQILNLKCHELDQVAQFMGHDVRVHREFYRLPHDVVQTARVVKVLMAMENGTISQYRGKSLADVDVSDDLGKSILPLCTYTVTMVRKHFMKQSIKLLKHTEQNMHRATNHISDWWMVASRMACSRSCSHACEQHCCRSQQKLLAVALAITIKMTISGRCFC